MRLAPGPKLDVGMDLVVVPNVRTSPSDLRHEKYLGDLREGVVRDAMYRGRDPKAIAVAAAAAAERRSQRVAVRASGLKRVVLAAVRSPRHASKLSLAGPNDLDSDQIQAR